MELPAASLPKVNLRRAEWIRMIVVGFFVVLAAARVAPDLVRVFYPLGEFEYVTNGDGVVVEAAPRIAIHVGDRILVNRIKPFDRKGGIVGIGYTYDNPNRDLHVERRGRVLDVHLKARRETIAGRALCALRIALFFSIVVLGAILFLVQPGIATAAILAYCLANEGPSSWISLQIPNPWRQLFDWYDNFSIGTASAALLLFAACLLVEQRRLQRAFAFAAGALAAMLGVLNAYAYQLQTYAAKPAAGFDAVFDRASGVVTWLTIGVFFAAFARARGDERRRIGSIVAAFALASAARLASETFYPTHIRPWENGILLSATILPILVVWVAVIRDRFFNVDLVVSRAVVYVALSGVLAGILIATEEVGTYVFMQNTDLAYGVLIVITMAVGSTTGKLREFIEMGVDRFIFRDRLARQKALELIAGYILDAETIPDIERALLEDATHALHLSFAGILVRDDDGAFRLGASYEWPETCVVRLDKNNALLAAIARTRGTMRFSGKESRLIKETFENEQLTFVAPLFLGRTVNALVVYGSSRIGLELDPDEREALIEVVSHASIAINAIELARYRSEAEAARNVVHT